MHHQPEPIRTYLNGGGSLAELQKQCRQLQQLDALIRRCLPAALARHLLSCSVSEGQLTLYAENASRATPLRLTTPKLLQKLQRDHGLEHITRIRVRITEIPARQQPDEPQADKLTDTTARLVADLAATAIDPEIKKILRRLSERGRKKPA